MMATLNECLVGVKKKIVKIGCDVRKIFVSRTAKWICRQGFSRNSADRVCVWRAPYLHW